MNENMVVIECQYFPSIGWQALACHLGRLFIDQSENYNKRSLRNKALINGTNAPVVLSVPLKKGKHSGKNIGLVEISYDQDWQQNHLRAIQSVYGKSPFYIHYIDEIADLINRSTRSLYRLDWLIAERIFSLLHIEVQLHPQNEFILESHSAIQVYRDHIRYTGQMTNIEQYLTQRMTKLAHSVDIPFEIGPRSSILDLLFYLGPESRLYLKKLFDSFPVNTQSTSPNP